MSTASSGTANTILTFIADYWWLTFIAFSLGGAMVEDVRDFFIDTFRLIAETRHRHRMAEIKARAKAEKRLAAAQAEPVLVPGPCQHLHVTPVIDDLDDDKTVAWLCKNEYCSAQLPVDWATRKKDLQ